ncbi:MAG: CHAT domain-containing protein [Ferruginibacter sp.]
MKNIKITVNGNKQKDLLPADPSYPTLVLKDSILVSNMRADSKAESLDLLPDDLVELVFDDDTRWLCPPDSLEDIYPGSFTKNRDGESFFALPTELDHPQLSRSAVGKILLKVINHFAVGKITGTVVEQPFKIIARDLEDKQTGKLKGLVRVNSDFELEKPEGINTVNPFILFLHGTNSSTTGSFAELKGTELWAYMVKTYGTNILAFQHETLTKSPLQNAAELVQQLPPNAELHIISHSRGGLIGEVLCRFSGASGIDLGFTKQELNLFESEHRSEDIKWIKELQKLYPSNNFRVKKFVRVACPSGGTTILSKRLDYFFNITLNLLGAIPALTVNPVFSIMKNLLIGIVDQKNDVDVLPGLEAMKPDSPFITILNNQSSTISIGEPMVAISGNCKMKLNLKALSIIASKLFFFEDNDLVVNTKSMYIGSKRRDKLQFFFDEGTDVDHFHYFKNKKTNGAILLALKGIGGSAIDGFSEFVRGTIGEAERNAILGLDGGQYTTPEPSGNKPIVILLPGIMGSSLTKNDDLLWINYLRFISGQLNNLEVKESNIEAPSLIRTSYKKLGEALQDEYDVVVFPFDWRLSLITAAAKFKIKIDQYLKLKKPIKIIGHSMGGVLVRDFMVYQPASWKKLNESEGFRLLFLGAPLGGSFRINNVIFGEDDIISKISKVDIVHTKKRLLKMFSKFPGLLCLLPFNIDADNNFAEENVWEKMRKAFGDKDWPIPETGDLVDFGKYRDKVTHSTSIDYSHAVYIAGQDKATPCGYRIDDTVRGTELVFLSTAEGDQSVTWDMGIPQVMSDAGTVYYVNYSHGALSNTAAIFSGIKEILAMGKTSLLSKNRPMVRGDQRVFKRPETSDFDLSPEGIEKTLLGISTEDEIISNQLPVKVKVSHCDLKYASYPLLAGHFKGDGILYAEERIDKLETNLLSEQHKLGIYPGDIGTHEIFLTHAEGFPGAIIVGLGEPDKLTSFELTRSVEHGITKYLLNANGNERINNQVEFKKPLGISSLIIACGYGGLTIENSVSAILQGIVNANAKVLSLYEEKKQVSLLIEQVEFIELYEDKALEAIYSIRRISKDSGVTLNITMEGTGLNELNGGRKQMNVDQGSEWWNRISVTMEKNSKGEAKGMRFTITTGAAREDLRIVFTSTGIVEQLVEAISTDNNWTTEKSRAIFELLIPNDFKIRLKKHGNTIWVLDKYTARFPWELLQDNGRDARPLCINAGMIRQLTTGDSRLNIEAVTDNSALVIGDPDLKGYLTQLPGALEEAKAVAAILREHEFETRDLIRASSEIIVPALVSSNYRIIHLAGHGIFDADPEKPSGMVIGKKNFLTSAEIAQMSTTPELVFVNCCFLGKTDGVAEEFFHSRFKLAANIGTQLIENGVKAVVVAGWAVDDTAAIVFAKKFYEALFDGKAFGDAVRSAREQVYKGFGRKNTWGAYQCYGDPFYKIRETKWSQVEKNYVIPAQAEIDLSNLLSDLKTGELKTQTALEKLTVISAEVDKQEIRNCAITELEAMIYKELNNYELAIEKFEQLMAFENASYSITAVEQYCNIRIKHLIKSFNDEHPSPDLEARFDKVMAELNALILLSPSAERFSLMGSAWKRKLVFASKNKDKTKNAILEAAKNYQSAYQAGKKNKNVYAYTNWFTLENILVMAGAHKWGQKNIRFKGNDDYCLPPADDILATLREMKADQMKKPVIDKYWDRIILSNIELCNWLLTATSGKVIKNMPDSAKVLQSYTGVWKMAGTKGEKQIETDHLDLIIGAIKLLAPKHFILPAIKQLRDQLKSNIDSD